MIDPEIITFGTVAVFLLGTVLGIVYFLAPLIIIIQLGMLVSRLEKIHKALSRRPERPVRESAAPEPFPPLK